MNGLIFAIVLPLIYTSNMDYLKNNKKSIIRAMTIFSIICFSITNISNRINNKLLYGPFGIGGPPIYKTQKYIVKPKENLWTIAQKRKLNQDTLMSVNKLKNANCLQVDQEILIPNQNGILHKVKTKEDIWSIAEKFNVSVEDILDVNDFSVSDPLKGKELFLPGAKLTSNQRLEYMGISIIRPLGGRITHYYGWRKHPITKRRSFHTGIDFGAPIGAPIKAAKKGKVILAGTKGHYGNVVILRHTRGYTTIYGHCSKLLVKVGDNVKKGQLIAKVGNTGRSTGPHLHFEIRRWGRPINPTKSAFFISSN